MTSSFKNPLKPTAGEIAKLETRVAFYQEKIAEFEALEKRAKMAYSTQALFQTAYDGLTLEEKAAINGMYLFIHSGMVDMVKEQPSATDRGEGREFVKMMAKAEAIALELQNQKGGENAQD
jgi:hypothetical protein